MSEVELSISPAAAWAALVAPGPRGWYFETEPRGEFAPGGRIEWMQGGRAVEESEVVEVEAGRRLRLRTRFVFSPALAAAPPVMVEWTVAPTAGGCRLVLTATGEGAGAALLEQQAEAILRGLRVALDPVAQAEVARLGDIGAVEVRDVTPERVGDYQRFFDGDAFRDYPAWQDCYCMHAVVDDDAEWAVRTGAENRAAMSERLGAGQTTALLAYAGDRPVGWCHWGTADRVPALLRHSSAEPEAGVGHLACFIVAAPYRRHGVARALLDAALDRMRAAGLSFAQAYPARARRSPQGQFRGPLSMYQEAGFETRRELERHLVVRKSLR